MKINTLFTQIAVVLSIFGCFSISAKAAETTASKSVAAEVASVGEDSFVAPGYKPGLIKHVVLFRYNDNVSVVLKKQIRDRFMALAYKCQRNGRRYIVSLETGAQSSGEGVDQELEQGFIVTFKSEGDRNYYVGKGIVQKEGNFDPAHDAFKAFVGQYLHSPIDPTGVLVFDFKVENK